MLGRGGDRAHRRARARGAGRARSRRGLQDRRGDDLESALAEVERIAPEHVVLLGDAESLAPRIRNAGAVFVGASSPVASGDYATGGNHVLPTGGWARSVGGLGLETFLKPVTVQRLTPAGLDCVRPTVEALAAVEGMPRARRGGAAMKALAPSFQPYRWAPTTLELARRAGIDPVELVRFDGNVPPLPLAELASGDGRCGARDGERVSARAVPACSPTRSPAYAGVAPENVVLGAGADDLILLVARAFAGPGDVVAIADEPTYSLYRVAAELAGASVGDDDPVLTFCCRPNNPTGALDPLPDARPLVVDEAYWEYSGADGAVGLIDDGVIVLRTFSKAFALAGARVGYALASAETAAELNARQAPAPVSSLSAALALAALASPPDLAPTLEERERLAGELRSLGYAPLPSYGSFLFVPVRRAARARRPPARPRLRRARLRERRAHHRARPRGRRPAARGVRRRGRRRRAAACATSARPPRRSSACASASTARAACASRPAPGSTTTSSSSSRSTAASTSILEGTGDLETGAHHTAEDAAIAFGEALDRALGDRRGIARYGDAVVPMDDALARAAVDLGGRRASVIDLQLDPGLAKHMLQSLADSGRMCINVEATGDGSAPRRRGGVQGGRPCAARCGSPRGLARPVDEGDPVKVAICRYGAGNVRSVELALARLGAELVDDVDGADLAILPGVGSARSAMDGPEGARRRRRPARAPCRRPADPRHLPRPAARARRERGGRRRPGPRARAGSCGAPASASASRASAGRRSSRVARRTGSRTRTPPRRMRRSRRARASRRSSSTARSPASSSIPRRAAPPARASWSDASPAPDPLPRRGGRPRRQGRQVPGPARRRRPGRARRRVLRRGRGRARLPRHLGDGRRRRLRGRRRRARRRAGHDSLHVRRRDPHARRRDRGARGGRGQDQRQLRGARAARS